MLVIALGYPVLLDVEGSSLTQGVLNFFRRKLKNCIKIALTVKVELPSHYWYTPYGPAKLERHQILQMGITWLFEIVSSHGQLQLWSNLAQGLDLGPRYGKEFGLFKPLSYDAFEKIMKSTNLHSPVL